MIKSPYTLVLEHRFYVHERMHELLRLQAVASMGEYTEPEYIQMLEDYLKLEVDNETV